jgi:NADH-quinone oxidoreductase subunit A
VGTTGEQRHFSPGNDGRIAVRSDAGTAAQHAVRESGRGRQCPGFDPKTKTSTPQRNTGPRVNLDSYLPILLFILVGLAVGAGPLIVGKLAGPSRPDPEKLSPYECGFEAFEDARMKFDVRYYLVAILFILFDLEIAFLFPWAAILGDQPSWGIAFWSMMVFLAILTVGFIYEWKKGALDWE